ncbi:MAG TPA: hypothetical protein VIW68_02435 [Candidatus Sulfotelmatobacter sp.]
MACGLAGLILALVTSSPLLAQDTFNGGSGVWSQPTNWSLNRLPGQSDNCVIPPGSSPTDDAAGVCLNLTMASGDALTIGTPTAPTAYLYLYGMSLINPGSITLTQTTGLHIAGSAGNTVTLNGGGTVNLTTPNNTITWAGTGETRLLNADNTIQGLGSIGSGAMDLTNEGTVIASGGTLFVQPAAGGLTNTGTMEASSGSTLELLSGFNSTPTFNNAGGTIKALSGGTVLLSGGTFTGGTFTTVGTGIVQAESFMSNITNTGAMQIPSGQQGTFEGTTNNTATIQTMGTMFINGTATLSGAGSMALSGAGRLQSLNGNDVLTNQQLIHGSGTIYALTLTNQATIMADDPFNPLIFAAASTGATPTTNTALIGASEGATLQIEDYVNNSGGTIQALTDSTVILTGTSAVNGGTLSSVGTGLIESQNALLDGSLNVPTNTGVLTVSNGNRLNVKGKIDNTGIIALDSTGGCIALNAATTITGTGEVTMAGPSDCIYASSTTDTFTNETTITGAGSIGDSNPMTVLNKGTIVASGATPLTIVGAGSGFTNSGKLYVNPGSTMNITGVFKNFKSTNTLSGGTYSLAGPLSFPNANIVTSTANLTLVGAAAQILNSTTSTNGLLNFAVNKGPLSLTLGQNLAIASNLTNSNKLTVDSTSSLSLGGAYTQTAGTTTLDGTLTAPAGVNLNGGALFGSGTIAGSLVSKAAVTAGDSSTKTAKLSANTYTQNPGGTLNIGIGGTTAGTQYGQLASANGVSLTGTLNLKRLHGFVPVIGTNFTIVTGSAVSGQFLTTTGLNINSSEHFQVNYATNAVTVTVVSGP